jgi:deoxyribodipyrimidine photo-lyase
MKNCLYWITKDLRINDNLAFHMANKSDKLLCVYVVDKKWFQETNFHTKPIGKIRWNFLLESLTNLNKELLSLGQRVHILYGDTFSTLSNLCDSYKITDVITTKLPGTYEQNLIKKIKNNKSNITFHQVEQFTLHSLTSLPFELNSLPESYSKFRKLLTNIKAPAISPKVTSLPPPIDILSEPSLIKPEWVPNNSADTAEKLRTFGGGEELGLLQINRYFSSADALNYKQVRNELDGWQNSSKFSPWLGYGCISAREVLGAINTLELQQGRNSSTECLYLELLWREYFQWLHFKNGAKTYQFTGIASTAPLTTFSRKHFTMWCLGNTPFPLVNACMNELRLTGFLSNRGRQIVASCLVNELNIDWRFGAAWFEERLIDYDAAVNWGNWQYIAGVGVDPQGGRHFNLEKQTNIYDAQGHYQAKWIENSTNQVSKAESLNTHDRSFIGKEL